MKSTVAGWIGLRSALVAAARQAPRRRIAGTAAVAAILVLATLLVPLPTAMQLRDWATSVGPWFPLAFLTGYVVVTVFPFPRTAFTLAAGLLFGPLLGATLAVLASTISALAALVLVRALRWRLSRIHPAMDRLDARLRRRGWPAIVSLRLIPVVPFSVLNYAAGASAVRVLPYSVATFVGLLPGTLAVVILGDALTGRINPWLVLVSFVTAGIGVTGLIWEARTARRQRATGQQAHPESLVA